MKVRQKVQPQDLNVERLASPLESPTLPVPLLSIAASSEPEQAEERKSKIQELAFRLYEERGRVDGRDLDDWLEAEAILQQEGRLAA